MTGYPARQVARLLHLPRARIRSYVRAGLVDPERGPRGEWRFGFRDVVLMRTLQSLGDRHVPMARLKRVVHGLEAQLSDEAPLTGVRLFTYGDEVLAQRGEEVWSPESGQVVFDFEADEDPDQVVPLIVSPAPPPAPEGELLAEDWFETGLDLEVIAPADARDAYRRALELDPAHVDARINLGRLLHEAGELEAAESHYRLAVEARPDDPTPIFNLGVVLEDGGRLEAAEAAYLRVINVEPLYREAYYNLAGIYERGGREELALQTLRAYKKLTEG